MPGESHNLNTVFGRMNLFVYVSNNNKIVYSIKYTLNNETKTVKLIQIKQNTNLLGSIEIKVGS